MMPTIVNRIRKLRFEHDEMTQAELAAKVGITRQTVHAIEQNKYAPSLETAFKIASVFREEIGAVFSYQDEL